MRCTLRADHSLTAPEAGAAEPVRRMPNQGQTKLRVRPEAVNRVQLEDVAIRVDPGTRQCTLDVAVQYYPDLADRTVPGVVTNRRGYWTR